MKFKKHCFWDIDIHKISIEEHMDLIIPRMLFFVDENTFENVIIELEEVYSKEEIIDTLKNTNENISNTVCLLVSKRYDIKPFLRWSVD